MPFKEFQTTWGKKFHLNVSILFFFLDIVKESVIYEVSVYCVASQFMFLIDFFTPFLSLPQSTVQ